MKPIFQIADDPFYSYSFQPIDSRMYLLLHRDKALIIDPCVSGGACDFLESIGIKEILILLTHEHFDHISGVNFWRGRFSCHVLCSEACARSLPHPTKNLSQYYTLLFCMQDSSVRQAASQQYVESFGCHADETFRNEKTFVWCQHHICLVETPGHSAGSICITIDGCAVFTGDSLTNSIPVVTRLPGGNRLMYLQISLPYLCSLNGEMLAFPGHGDPQKLNVLIEREMYNASQG